MKKSLATAYGMSKRMKPGKRISDGEVKKQISPMSDKGRLVDILMERRKAAKGGKPEQEEEGSGEELQDLNEEAVGESTDDDSDADTDVIANQDGEDLDEDSDLSARARKRMKARK